MVGTLRPATGSPPRNPPDSAGPPAAARRLTPRTGLPGGRAALGGLLVALAALALFVALTQSGRDHDTAYVVAARALPQGATLTATDLAVRHGPIDGNLRARTLPQVRDAVGRVLLAPVSAGDPLLRHQVADAAAATVAPQLSFAVSPERALGGTLRVGDHLRVLVTYGQDADAPTEVAAPDVEVLDVRQGGDEALGSSSALVVTVAVPRDQDATALARASAAGKLTLVRLGASRSAPPAGSNRTSAGPGTAASGSSSSAASASSEP